MVAPAIHVDGLAGRSLPLHHDQDEKWTAQQCVTTGMFDILCNIIKIEEGSHFYLFFILTSLLPLRNLLSILNVFVSYEFCRQNEYILVVMSAGEISDKRTVWTTDLAM